METAMNNVTVFPIALAASSFLSAPTARLMVTVAPMASPTIMTVNICMTWLPFDTAVMADLAADRLKLQNKQPLAMVRETESGLKGIGSTGDLTEEMTLADLAIFVRKAFNLPQVRCYGKPDTKIRRVSMCPGSGKGMDGDVLEAGGQVFITGDVDHHYGIDCVEKGICVIDAGHHGLEHIFVPFMEQWMQENCPEIETVTDGNQSPFFVV